MLRVKIQVKTNHKLSVGVRTVDAEATSPKDYIAIDQVIDFDGGRLGKKEAEVQIKIIDDENWEPDEDFFVELYDIETGVRLPGEDTRTRITIMDDDRPGMLAFAEKKQLRHPADQNECRVVIKRTHGADGDISVQFETYEIDKSDRTATPDVDYRHTAGTLHFKHREVEAEIVVPIL